MNLDFFLDILNAMNIGDVINDVAYQIRPFEVNAGETDRVLDECMDMLQEVMRRKRPWTLEGKLASLLGKTELCRHRGIPGQIPEPALRRRLHRGAQRSARPL